MSEIRTDRWSRGRAECDSYGERRISSNAGEVDLIREVRGTARPCVYNFAQILPRQTPRSRKGQTGTMATDVCKKTKLKCSSLQVFDDLRHNDYTMTTPGIHPSTTRRRGEANSDTNIISVKSLGKVAIDGEMSKWDTAGQQGERDGVQVRLLGEMFCWRRIGKKILVITLPIAFLIFHLPVMDLSG